MVVILHPEGTVRARAVDVCTRMGRPVVALESTAALYELLRMNRADAILLDGSNPHGMAVVRELRSKPGTATTSILWLGNKPAELNDASHCEDKILAEPDVYLPINEFDIRLEIELQRLFSDPEVIADQDNGDVMRILVIDDSLTYRMQLSEALTQGGYEVTLAETGEAGLEAAFRGSFAAVLVDNMLPGIQGPAVIRRLRAESATRRVPCILLTASEDPESELNALDAGADNFVRKDEPTHTILLRLAAILRTSSAPAAFQYSSAASRRVLMAGPRSGTLTALRESLLADGVVLVEETEAERALTRASRDPLDAILLMLPHHEAISLCRRLKETPRLASMRVLVMDCGQTETNGAGTIAERQVAALQAGADDFLSSALPVRNLRARLETQLRRKQMEDENRALHDHILRQQVEAESQRRLAAARSIHAEEIRLAKEAVELEAREAEGARFRLEKVMEALPQIVLMMSDSGELLAYNRRWMQYVGTAPLRLAPEMWRQSMHLDDLERYLADRAKAQQQGIGFAGEYRLRSASGEQRWFYIQVSAMAEYPELIAAAAPEIIEQLSWLITCTDIHDRKLAEEALRRTEKLAATGRLAASIAHEINNPLEAVTNLLFLVEHATREVDKSVHDFVVSAQQEVGRVSEIAKKTLTFYRETKNPAPVDLGVLVQETHDVYASRLRHKRVTLEFEVRTDLKPLGMSGELRQVMSNMVANAIDASPSNSVVKVRVHASRHRQTGREGVRILVWDRGDGIPERLRPDLFKPFITTKGQNGTGLGLWVASSIAARHEGELRFWSSVNKPRNGTCFSFFLPLDGKVQMADDSISEMMKQIGSELLHK